MANNITNQNPPLINNFFEKTTRHTAKNLTIFACTILTTALLISCLGSSLTLSTKSLTLVAMPSLILYLVTQWFIFQSTPQSPPPKIDIQNLILELENKLKNENNQTKIKLYISAAATCLIQNKLFLPSCNSSEFEYFKKFFDLIEPSNILTFLTMQEIADQQYPEKDEDTRKIFLASYNTARENFDQDFSPENEITKETDRQEKLAGKINILKTILLLSDKKPLAIEEAYRILFT